MRVPDDERAVILKDVGGKQDDCAIICGIIETLYKKERVLSYDVTRAAESGQLTVRLAQGFDIFTSANARCLFALSQRIHDVRILFSKKRIIVTVLPAAGSQPQWQPAFVRRRTIAIDYGASKITNTDDIALIDSIVNDAYALAVRMPDMKFYLEPIVDGFGAVLEHTGMEIPLTGGGGRGADSEDASESSMGGSKAPESARVGYSLCFSNVPDIGADFFQHLHDAYGIRIAAAYGWLSVSPPMLVVNIRRINLAGTTKVLKVINHLPRPLKSDKKRSGADDDSQSTSTGHKQRRMRVK